MYEHDTFAKLYPHMIARQNEEVRYMRHVRVYNIIKWALLLGLVILVVCAKTK